MRKHLLIGPQIVPLGLSWGALSARALGLQRTGCRARERISAAIDEEKASGRIGCDSSGQLKVVGCSRTETHN
jgi:hypothetical protein